MFIQNNSIHDFGDKFSDFESSLEGPDYVLLFQGIAFTYKGGGAFTLKNLITLFEHNSDEIKNIQGTIEVSTLQILDSKINYALSFVSNNTMHEFTSDSLMIAQRYKQYWEIVNHYFPYQPTHIFEHIPTPGTYFGDCVMWQFTFILLHEGYGAALAGQAWD